MISRSISVALVALAATAVAGVAVTSAATTKPATVSTHKTTLGTVLSDSSGRTLYLWLADPKGRSVCSGSCAKAWPPVLTKGRPKAKGGVKSSLLGTVSRSGGTQVTYKGHPLYYFVGDKKAGQVTGQGSNGFGAKWWALATSGAAVTRSASEDNHQSGNDSPNDANEDDHSSGDDGAYGY